MQIEVGNILEGKIASITKFGAFVDFEGGKTGMVHISEVSNEYVEDISEHLNKGDIVKVKVIGINEAGKISLSIKKAAPRPQYSQGERQQRSDKPRTNSASVRPGDRTRSNPGIRYDKQKGGFNDKKQPQGEVTFEDMLKKFQQSSDEKLTDLKRSTNNKQSSAGYSRRGK